MSSSSEETTSGEERMLSIEEAEERVWKSVDDLEAILNKVNNQPGKRDETRRAHLAAHFMELLAKTHGIKPPR